MQITGNFIDALYHIKNDGYVGLSGCLNSFIDPKCRKYNDESFYYHITIQDSKDKWHYITWDSPLIYATNDKPSVINILYLEKVNEDETEFVFKTKRLLSQFYCSSDIFTSDFLEKLYYLLTNRDWRIKNIDKYFFGGSALNAEYEYNSVSNEGTITIRSPEKEFKNTNTIAKPSASNKFTKNNIWKDYEEPQENHIDKEQAIKDNKMSLDDFLNNYIKKEEVNTSSKNDTKLSLESDVDKFLKNLIDVLNNDDDSKKDE